jgi:hypothetical protein
MSKATQRVVERMELSMKMLVEHKRLETLENYQPYDYLRVLFEVKALKE